MRLHKMQMISFRGHVNTEVFFDDSFTAIIGKNDVGKSSILEALEIFFNNDTVKIDIDDCNINSKDQEVVIEVTFDIDKFDYVVDTIPTNFREEYLLDNGRLTIRKKWSCSGKSITAASLKTFIVADYPVGLDPLLSLKISDLRKKLEDYKGLIDVDSVKKNTSSQIRCAIYKTYKSSDLARTEILLDKEDSKKIWDTLKLELPIYCLFQSDRANKDTDREVQDPLKAITKNAISQLEKDLERVKREIKAKAEELGKQTLEKLKEMNPDIASVLSPEMTNKPWESLFSFTFNSDDGIPINKRGSGVRRLIMLNYFRAEADRRNVSEGRSVIYAIEEPETSQHPDWQLKLVESLINLSSKENTQVLITTHSPYLTKVMSLESLRFVKVENKKLVVKKGNPEIVNEIIESLGMLPDIGEENKDRLKLVLCLEGPTDVKFFNKVDEYFGVNLETDERVMVLTVGGSTVSDWVNRNCLKKLNKKEIHIYDRDHDNKYQGLVDQLNGQENVFATLTSSVCIECYHHPNEVVVSITEANDFFTLGENWQRDWANKEIPKELSAHLKTKSEDGLKPNSVKKRFAEYVRVSEENLRDLNVYDEVNGWFQRIIQFME